MRTSIMNYLISRSELWGVESLYGGCAVYFGYQNYVLDPTDVTNNVYLLLLVIFIAQILREVVQLHILYLTYRGVSTIRAIKFGRILMIDGDLINYAGGIEYARRTRKLS